MDRVLVAGAIGYVGRFVAREFKNRDYWVRTLARDPEKLKAEGRCLEPAVFGLVDDVFVGQATKPETLQGLCDGIDVVFSSIGITRQKDKLSYMDVDYQANKNILDLALRASVRRFIFIYGFNADSLLRHLDAMQARHRFIQDLKESGLEFTVVSPNGFFDDMSEFLDMAKHGTVFLIGDGTRKINPIHGADLAVVCVNAVTAQQQEIPVGGPVIYTYREIAELAFAVLGKAPRIRKIPVWAAHLAAMLIRPFNSKYSTLAAGLATITQHDFVAPQYGTHTLKSFYEELASRD